MSGIPCNTEHSIPSTVQAIAEQIVSTFTEEDIAIVRDVADRRSMVQFHLTVGMVIRNEYNFWIDHPLTEQYRIDTAAGKTDHLRDGIDYHLCHPDAVSMDVLCAVWDIVHT